MFMWVKLGIKLDQPEALRLNSESLPYELHVHFSLDDGNQCVLYMAGLAQIFDTATCNLARDTPAVLWLRMKVQCRQSTVQHYRLRHWRRCR